MLRHNTCSAKAHSKRILGRNPAGQKNLISYYAIMTYIECHLPDGRPAKMARRVLAQSPANHGSHLNKLARGAFDGLKSGGYLALTAWLATVDVARQRPQFFCPAHKLHFLREGSGFEGNPFKKLGHQVLNPEPSALPPEPSPPPLAHRFHHV